MVVQDPFPLLGAGVFKRLFTSQSTMLVELATVHSESTGRAISFE